MTRRSAFRSCFSRLFSGAHRQPHAPRRVARPSRLFVEALELRIVPSALPPPNPIDPNRGQANLLRVVQMMADKQNLNAQDHFPVPYVIIVSAGGAAPTVMNWHAGTAIQLDADRSKATGQGGGGKDIQVEVNTDLYTNVLGKPDWKLRLNVNRLGTGSFAQNLSVMIAFPWNAFDTNKETLPAQPNLLMGFQTRLPGTAGQASYITGLDGGNAPATMQMVLTPHILAGTTHTFEWSVDTTGATNPLTFVSGEFDGTPGSNSIVDALGWSAYVQNVPAHIGAALSVAENAIGSPAVDSKMDLHWTASAASLTTFDYLEAESAGAAASPQTANYATEVVADKTPTDEHFVLRQDEAGGVLTLNHDANAPIHEMTFLKTRSDGLALTGVASDDNPALDAVPTHVALTLGLRGYENLDVNANTLDLFLQDTQDRGFNNTSQFFQKYNLEYVALRVKNAPDQSANFDGATKTFTVSATNAGESVPYTEMVLDDNGRISATNAPLNLDLPDKYTVTPLWDLWSIVDDGTHGTAVARALDAKTASYNHYAPDVKETVELQTVVQHPLETYLRSGLLSAVQPPFGPAPDPYIEVQGHVEDVPVGHTTVVLDFPLTVIIHSESKIGEVCMAGHIGFLNFALILDDNPTNSSFDFRPEGSLVVKALNDVNHTPLDESDDVPDFFTANAAVVYDVTGFDPTVLPWPVTDSSGGFHSVSKTFFPGGTRLKEARLRVDRVPSFKATWDNEPQHTYVDIGTVFNVAPYAYVGGVQIQVSTMTTLAGTTLTCDNAKTFLPPAATPASEHYALLKDVAGEQTLKFGIFGVHTFHFASDDTKSPSKFTTDWSLDPSRPFTAAHLNVDTHSTASGALGTFFGGSTVTGPLDVGYVPPDFHIASNFDPTLSTQTLFPGGLPIPNVISQQFTVNGTQIFVYAQQIPKVFSVTWNDDTNPTTTLAITAQDNLGNPDKAQLVEVLFLNPTGLPGGDKLFNDATNPLRELRVRLDDVPSLTSSWTTTGATNINVQTTNAAPFDVLGGLRLSTSTVAGSTVLPTFPAPGTSDDHYVSLQDAGAGGNKTMAFGLFGVRQFTYTDPGWIHTTYNGNVNRRFVATINSNNGRFFPGHVVKAALVVNTLPQLIDLLAATDGTDLSYRASSGITSIQIGGLALAGLAGDPYATYDTRRVEVTLSGLPGQLGYDLADGGQFGFSAGAKVSNLTVWLRDSSTGGLDSGAGILGPAMHDLRLRVDGVPSFTGDSTSLISVPYTANNAGVRPVPGNVLYDTGTGATAVVTKVDGTMGALFDGGTVQVRLGRTAAFANGDSLDVLDALAFNGQAGLFTVGDVITGKTSGATAVVRRADQLAAAGTLYVNGVSGTFQNGEKLLVNGQVMALVNGTLQVTPDWVAARVAGDPKTLESQMDFSTSVPGVSLTGVQVGLSTRFEDPDNPAFTVAQPPTYFLNLFDQNVPSVGEVARLRAGLSTIQQVSYASVDQGANSPLNRFHLVADTARRLDVNLNTKFGSKLTSDGLKGTVTVQDVPATWDLTTDLKKTIDHKGSSVISHIDVDVLKDDSGDGFGAPFKGHHLVVHIVDVPTMFNADLGIGDTTATAQSPVTKQHKHVHANGPVTSIFFEDTKDLPSSKGRPSWTLLQVNGLPGSFDYDVEKDFSVDDKKNLTKTKSTTTVVVKDPGGSPAPLPFFRMVNSNLESKAVTLAKDLARFTNIAGGLVQRSDFAATVDNRYWPAGVQDRLNDIYGSSFHLDTDPLNTDPTFQLADRFLQQSFGELTIPGVEVKLSGKATATTTTDANGNYVFGGLSDGTYQITETQPAGATDGPVNVGTLGGTAGTNTVSNIVVGKVKDKDGNDVIQTGVNYNFGELSLPNPGLPAGPAQPGIGAGTLSGRVYQDENGDGVFNETDLVDYTDIQLHGFQSAEEIEDKVAKNTHVELQVPSTGSHPFFVGMETERNNVTIARIDNLPSSVKLDYTEKDHLDFTASSSAGRVDVYQGPLPAAGDGDTAIRAILLNTPTSVHIGYGFGFPNGGIDFTTSNQFELRLLQQDGSQRIVAGLSMQELRIGYGLSGLLVGGGFGDNVADTTLGVDDAWWLIKYAAGVANNTDGTGINESLTKAPVNGFFGLYERRNDIVDLNPAGPAHGAQEYVPHVTAMLKDFREFSLGVGLAIDPLDMLDNIAWTFPIGLALDKKFDGTLDFDVWFNADTYPHISALGYDIGFLNRPDYSDNSPFMIFPITVSSPFDRLGIDHDAVFTFEGFHYLSDEIDPFAPQLAPGMGPGAAPADVITAVPAAIVREALSRWRAAGYDTSALGAVKVGVADLPDAYLGTVTGGTVWIDQDAAGYGWYIDPTPGDDSEFPAVSGSAAYGREDLLTVVMHEMGHLLGFNDGGDGLMETVLDAGVRQTPSGTAAGSATGSVAVASLAPATGAGAAAGGGGATPAFLDPAALRYLLAADAGRAVVIASALSGGPTLPPRSPDDDARAFAPAAAAPPALLDLLFGTTPQGAPVSASEADGLTSNVELWPWSAKGVNGEPDFLA